VEAAVAGVAGAGVEAAGDWARAPSARLTTKDSDNRDERRIFISGTLVG
jgi:hypothetical protein